MFPEVDVFTCGVSEPVLNQESVLSVCVGGWVGGNWVVNTGVL